MILARGIRITNDFMPLAFVRLPGIAFAELFTWLFHACSPSGQSVANKWKLRSVLRLLCRLRIVREPSISVFLPFPVPPFVSSATSSRPFLLQVQQALHCIHQTRLQIDVLPILSKDFMAFARIPPSRLDIIRQDLLRLPFWDAIT